MSEREVKKNLKQSACVLSVCVCFFLIIPMKSRFLNPVAQADTLNKIILIPHMGGEMKMRRLTWR